MDYRAFYSKLFRPVEEAFGPIDSGTMMAIIGFDAGGPLSFRTVGREKKNEFVTYVSCELAVREEQVPSDFGRFELLCHSNDEAWVRKVLTKIGQMSFETEFGHGHTVDISERVGSTACLSGVAIERIASLEIESKEYCILRVHGISAGEMQIAMDEDADALFERLKKAGVYPNTDVHRRSIA